MEKQNRIPLSFASLALALANDYISLYVIDSEDDSYIEYAPNGTEKELVQVSCGDNFYQDLPRSCRELVWEEDQESFLNTFRKENVTQALENGKSFSLTYRLKNGGAPRYSFLKTIRADDRSIIIGVQDIDEQKRRELAAESASRTYSEIAESLASRYEVIYHVNIVTDEYIEYSASDKYANLKVSTRGKDFFADSQTNMQRDIYPEDLPMMMHSMQKDNLLGSLAESGKTFLSYRLMLDGRPQYVSLYAVRPKKDSEHIIIAVANVDAAKRMEFAYQSALDMANRDALTGVKNKRAYVQAETDLDRLIDQHEYSPFAVVVCDINGLKDVNDTQGHKAGDDFIRSACAVICNVFKHSPVFRIGGDEFAVILRGDDYAHRTELMQALAQMLAACPHNGVVLLAVGISDFDPAGDMRVQDVFERADKQMYQHKKICKADNS